jgi:hypothetical protein
MHKLKTRKHRKNKSRINKICDENMTFQECELAILRQAVDKSGELQGRKITNSEEVQRMLKIVEEFIVRKKLLLYGGTAVNDILPKFAQFYNRDIEVPDYDFYSPDALQDAKELADIFYEEGYIEVEAKAAIHMGTFKVYVNFIPIADITQMHQRLYKALLKDAIIINRIHYTPPNYLRMSMYLELSRPSGDVTRWEKILKRLTLLNKYFPLDTEKDCHAIDFHKKEGKDHDEELYIQTRDALINQGVVFFGGYAASLYSRYVPEHKRLHFKQTPDFDVLSDEPDKCATILKESLERSKFKKITVKHYEAIGDIIPYHVGVEVDGKNIVFVYKPIACHSYNRLTINNKEINIATIDTILTFYLSFWYANMEYYNKDRLLCMAKYLYEIEAHNRLAQKGLLKRFSIDCYGKQQTMEEIRSEKAEKYRELVRNRKSKEYEMWFLKYSPHHKKAKKSEITDEEIARSINKLEGKEDKDEEDSPQLLKKKEKSFIQRFIGSPYHSKKSSHKRKNLVNPILRMLRGNSKTKKIRESEFLF